MKIKKQIIREYTSVFQEELEGGYSVWIPELPGCASQGETFEEALQNIKEAITLYLEDTDKTSDNEIEYKKQFVVPVKISYA